MENLREEFKWCGYTWETCMENGRPIHADYPKRYYSKNKYYPRKNPYNNMITHNRTK